ncbi:sialidase family protein [Mucilaginibacter sp. FT3.2]|uniref:sialidase family protein n=1 Tax=Mucilaginibacter sp. FT3.2 TaxID=2723090 RepID=UPI00160D265D|nr:sialidase family protein [Mucilaginibacter sp. FT3.2]MBB6229798.1 sialidase-1 [Mucilaginibacter sp. FT3.2]
MKKLTTYILINLLVTAVYAQQQEVAVFKSGFDGYRSFRIPAITKAPNGDLLAFAEGRVNGGGDFGNIQIVLKRSSDGGKHWGGLQVVASNDTLQTGNAAPVVDSTDPAYPKGRLFLFYNTGNASENMVRKGKGLREVWYKTSTDNGLTWAAPVNITLQVHKPKQPQVNSAYNFKEDWRSYANTPGHAIQLAAGKYKGRIYVAANHSAGEPQKHYADGRAFGYYTDDHGQTFKLSDEVNMPGANENMAVELAGNKLMMNIRNQLGNIKQRIIAVSSNGGQTWDTTYFDAHLPDPICQGSILNVGKSKGKAILAVCNDADTLHRDNLTLRISFDEGKTWKQNDVIAKSPAGYQGDFSAYSDLVPVDKRHIGILYEKDDYKQIVFTQHGW